MTLICTPSPLSHMFPSFLRAWRKVQRGLAGLSLILCHSAAIASQGILNKKANCPCCHWNWYIDEHRGWGHGVECHLWRRKSDLGNWPAVLVCVVLKVFLAMNISVHSVVFFVILNVFSFFFVLHCKINWKWHHLWYFFLSSFVAQLGASMWKNIHFWSLNTMFPHTFRNL